MIKMKRITIIGYGIQLEIKVRIKINLDMGYRILDIGEGKD